MLQLCKVKAIVYNANDFFKIPEVEKEKEEEEKTDKGEGEDDKPKN